MPFIDQRTSFQDISNLAGPEQEQLDPSLLETAGAAFRTQSIVGSFLASRGAPDPYVYEEGFDAIDYVKDDPKYSTYADSFAGIFNRRAADAMKVRIDREEQDRRTLDAAGGMGVVAEMAAGIVDLPTLIPLGGPLVSGVRSTAVRVALGAGIDAGVSEAGLQATQETRTGEETALNIGGSIVLGGALGGLAGRYLDNESQRILSKKVETQNDRFEEFDNAVFGAQSAGAAARERGPLELKDEAVIRNLYGINRQDPMIRLQLNDLDEARGTVRGLAETPLEYRENAAGMATEEGGSVETRMKMWNAPLANSLRNIDVEYARYFNNAPDPSSWQIRLSPARSEFARLTGKTEKLTYQQFKEEVAKAAFSGERHQIPEVAAGAQQYRQIDDQMKRAAIEAGLFPEDVAVKGDVSHLFRMYNREKIIARRDEFAAILRDHFRVVRNEAAAAATKATDQVDAKLEQFARLSDAEVDDVVNETINTILGNGEGRIPYDGIVSGPRGPLKERILNIASQRIQDFLELDIEKVLHAQVRTMSADVELAKKFGTPDLAEQIRKINDEADRRITGAKSAKERERLEKARKDAVRDVEGIRDRLRGQYALPDNPDGIVLRAGRVIRNLNYVRLLGGMTVSAIPDMGKVVFAHGLTSTFRDGFVPLVTNWRGFRLAAEEVKSAGTALDMVLDSRTMAMADITQEFGRHSKFERSLQALSSKFGVVSLMAPWNAAMKQFSGMITMTSILKAARASAGGAASKKQITALAASGIDEHMAKRIADMFAKHGDEDGSVLLAKGANWTDTKALEAFRAAVVREVDKTVVTPGQDKPLWMSTELGKVIGQFKSFGVSSVQKTMLAGIQQRDAAALQGVLVMLALGAFTYKLKSDMAGRETSDNASVWAVEAFDRSGLAGWLMEVNNASEKITRGKVGLSAITGKPMSRYASRNAVASLLGPTVGTTQDILTVIGAAASGEYGPSDAKRARQLIPAQNLFWARSVFDQVETMLGGEPGE